MSRVRLVMAGKTGGFYWPFQEAGRTVSRTFSCLFVLFLAVAIVRQGRVVKLQFPKRFDFRRV
jgi:hypothetical protein